MAHLAKDRFDDRSVVMEEPLDFEETVRKYDEINAKTMFNMMETVGQQKYSPQGRTLGFVSWV